MNLRTNWNANEGWRRRLRARCRRERLFRMLALGAMLLSGAFLVFFFQDVLRGGFRAFQQAHLQVGVHYSEEAAAFGDVAVDGDVQFLVSRGYLRVIPRRIVERPELLGRRIEEWVPATSDVDQYLKGRPNRLAPEEIATVERLRAEGRTRLGFNTGFLLNGDSQLPEMAGIRAAVVGTIYMLLITMLVSVPIGVMTAVYLEEFASDNRLTRLIEVNISNLAAIPSILFGLLGLAVFVNFVGVPRSSALAGGLTLALMMLPIVIISTRAALRAVPDGIRHGALAVGASRWQTVRYHVLPQALPGILTGSILGLAQAMGETAPLLIIGMVAYIPDPPGGLTDAATALPVQVFSWFSMSQRGFEEKAAAAILVLLAVLMLLNATAIYLRNRYEKRW